MTTRIVLKQFVTKSLNVTDDKQRIFEGILSAEVVDKQNEVTFADELMKVLPIWMDRGAPISDTHTNRYIGRGLGYFPIVIKDNDGNEVKGIKIIGKIYSNWTLDNIIWNKIKDGTYKGLSFGGATTADRVPLKMKDGTIAYGLTDLEQYEVAVCEDPAVPIALITDINQLSKHVEVDQLSTMNVIKTADGKALIRCTKATCYIEVPDVVVPATNSDILIKGSSSNIKQINMAGVQADKQPKVTDEDEESKSKTKKVDDEKEDSEEQVEEVKTKKQKSSEDSIDRLAKALEKKFENDDKWKSDVEKTLLYITEKIEGTNKAMETPTDKKQADNSDVKMDKKPYDTSEQRGDEVPDNPDDKEIEVTAKKSQTKKTVEVAKAASRPDDDSNVPKHFINKSGKNQVLEDLRKGTKTMEQVSRDLLFGDYGTTENTWENDPSSKARLPA